MSSPERLQPSLENRSRRLWRSRDDRLVAGVAGGLGRYLGVDPVIVRLVFVVLAVAGGGGVLAYLIAWVVIPEAPADGQDPPVPGGSGTSMIAGLVLVALGAILFVDRVVPGFSWRFVGPVLLVALGVVLLARGREAR
jgi:phage shock protein C